MNGRIPMLSLEESRAQAEAAGLPPRFAELSVFRTLLRRPAIAKAVSDLLLANFGSRLDPRLRELVIMRLGWATGSDYEWTQHWHAGREQFGCSDADLLGVRSWHADPHYGAVERAVLTATDEALETGTLSDATFSACAEQLGDAETCLDLLSAIATWRMISMLLRSLEIPLEEGTASWPPDGRAPDPPKA